MKTLRSANAVIRDLNDSLERSVHTVVVKINTIAKDLTPVRTGRARRGWKLRDKFKLGRNRRTVIENRVPYIGILDRRVNIIKPAADRAVYTTRQKI